NKAEISAVVDKVRKIHIGTSILSTLVIIAFCILRALNIISASAALVLYIAEVILANIAIADIIVVIYIARKELRKTRIVCFVLYFVFVLVSLAALWITDENIFFVINTCLLVFLLMALQTDDLNRSSEDRKKAQSQAADLNTQLKFSKEKLQIETFLLEEISGVYDSLHLIDLKNNTYRQLGAPPPKAEAIITGELADAGNQALIWAIMNRVTSPLYTEGAIAFTDFSTLNERMKGKKVITYEAIDDENQWFRFSFIRVGNDLDTDLETVIYTSMNIDEEKRETEHLRQVSYVDELTGVYNRNYYITHCDAFRDAGAPDSIWMIVVDINGLKAVNDDIGHEAGDELIIATARCLKEAFGDGGNVFRIGGDEFIVSVHATDSEFAEMLEKLENL
ncbi:MAG: GGDEF domain-containing protein, partial [Parasporobacterium sp.]|nr:GGDEF domain-containing protein [Parasporobacterium sp.]